MTGWRWLLAGIPLVAVASAALPSPAESALVRLLSIAGVNVVLAIGVALVNGFTGLPSFAHAGFLALGIAANAVLPTALDGALVPVFAGALLAAIVALVAGIPLVRLPRVGVVALTLLFSALLCTYISTAGTGGNANLATVYAVVLVVVVLARRLRSSTIGRAFIAIREDALAARAVGIDVSAHRLRAFITGAAIFGVAGALLAQTGAHDDAHFGWLQTFEPLLAVVVAGPASVSGTVVCAVVITLLSRGLGALLGHDGRVAVVAVLSIALMLSRTAGFFGTLEAWEVFARWRARRMLRVS